MPVTHNSGAGSSYLIVIARIDGHRERNREIPMSTVTVADAAAVAAAHLIPGAAVSVQTFCRLEFRRMKAVST